MIPGIPYWIIYACSRDVFVNVNEVFSSVQCVSVEAMFTYQPLYNMIHYTGFGYKK